MNNQTSINVRKGSEESSLLAPDARGGQAVAPVGNLLYHRLAIGVTMDGSGVRSLCRLPADDTADSQSALRQRAEYPRFMGSFACDISTLVALATALLFCALSFGQSPATTGSQTSLAIAPTNSTAKAIARAPRRLEQEEVRLMLSEALERQLGTDGGELEIQFARPWTPVMVAPGPLVAEIIEPTLNRLSSTSFVRFEVISGKQVLGSWQASLQFHLWRQVLVAHTSLQRGATLSETDIVKERRDVLTLRDPICELPAPASACELADNVPLGAALMARSIRLKPVVFRGQTADAVVRDGTMTVSLKVEILEEGAPGQMVRVRNVQSRRELRGKVQDEQTIAIPL